MIFTIFEKQGLCQECITIMSGHFSYSLQHSPGEYFNLKQGIWQMFAPSIPPDRDHAVLSPSASCIWQEAEMNSPWSCVVWKSLTLTLCGVDPNPPHKEQVIHMT